jgi:hypothetical protein
VNALDRLVDGLFDYAGLFPPAALEFEKALKTSAGAAERLKRPRIVGADFVLQYDSLDRIASPLLTASGFPKAKTFHAAVLGAAVVDAEPAANAKEIEALAAFNESRAAEPVRQRVVSYEIKLNLDGFERRDHARLALDRVRRELGDLPIRLYVEPDWAEDAWEDRWDWFWAALDGLNADPSLPGVCPKVRGSGPTAIEPQRLARVVEEVNARSLPFKATAGLHHPLVESERYGNPLGFLGLAAALRLQRALGSESFSREAVLECLAETDPGAFDFKDGLRWKDFHAPEKTIEDAVLGQPFGIGSCSLDEPDADLARLFPSLEPAPI